MSKHKQADVQVTFTVQFDDDGKTDLNYQALAVAGEMVFGRMVDHEITVLKVENDKRK